MLLAINTASSQTSIALIDQGTALSESSWPSHNNEAEKLMPAIHQLLGKFSYEDLKSILVIQGPGSFTGLRVGVTVANTIAHLTTAQLYCIDSFQYHWQKLLTSQTPTKNTDSTALLIYAGSRGVYVQLQPDHAPEVINLQDLNDYLSQHHIETTFGDISEAQQKTLRIPHQVLTESFAETTKKIDLQKLPPQKMVEPKYIKPPSITKSKQKVFNN